MPHRQSACRQQRAIILLPAAGRLAGRTWAAGHEYGAFVSCQFTVGGADYVSAEWRVARDEARDMRLRMGHSGNASQGARKLNRAGAQKLRQMKSVLEEISENEQCKILDSED